MYNPTKCMVESGSRADEEQPGSKKKEQWQLHGMRRFTCRR